MEVFFAARKLEKICNSATKLRGEYGPQMAALIMQRLAELADIETLEEIKLLPGPRCHELKHNLKGCLAVDLVHPNRLVFRPTDSKTTRKPDGGLDWSRVKSIEIVGIGDYH